MAYRAPLADMQFVLHEVLGVSGAGIPGYGELDPDTTAAIVGEAGRLSEEVLAPLNRTGDAEGCRFEGGTVTTPTGFTDAYAAMREGGWLGLDADPAHGGQGMPYVMNAATGELFAAANMAFNMYQGLTHAAVSTLAAHGSEAQKATYLPPMVEGRWSGTMNLTEPQCGTDLGLIRTRAEPAGDGIYRLTGQKIWISSGEHDLTENIVHLVLARLPDAPEGTRGISLFVVPKMLVEADGNLGARNAVACSGLEHKMGIHGNATCAMSYDGATGFLVGEPHAGLKAMFTMMNEARLGVGLQGYAQAAAAHQIAVDFARERLQGRAVTGAAAPDQPADPIIVHPDVRRALIDQRAFVEGARAFALWGATLIDRARRNHDAEAEALVSLLTPVHKAFLTDRGFDTAVSAQQVLGGTGYVRDGGIEQIVRDARITMIYEGTNGIQALDLVGRKLGRDGGKAVSGVFRALDAFLADAKGDARLDATILAPLERAVGDLQSATAHLARTGPQDPDAALAGSHDFLHLFGHVCLGWMWARMARAACAARDAGRGDAAFLEAKLVTARAYMARQLPLTRTHLARIEAGAEPVMALPADAF